MKKKPEKAAPKVLLLQQLVQVTGGDDWENRKRLADDPKPVAN